MENYIIIAIVLCIIVGIVFYLYRAKKRGETCIGCPYSKQCSSSNNSNSCGGRCNGGCHGCSSGCNNTKNENDT
ncbi:MAG: hypothetical protein IJZ94_05850 [Clostridia bacterium]|nr:hypothetical protein [Clostridia bacterium]